MLRVFVCFATAHKRNNFTTHKPWNQRHSNQLQARSHQQVRNQRHSNQLQARSQQQARNQRHSIQLQARSQQAQVFQYHSGTVPIGANLSTTWLNDHFSFASASVRPAFSSLRSLCRRQVM